MHSVVLLTVQHVISDLALRASVEKLYLTCGMLTAGRCNGLDKSLKMHAWLKVNHYKLSDIDN